MLREGGGEGEGGRRCCHVSGEGDDHVLVDGWSQRATLRGDAMGEGRKGNGRGEIEDEG